MILTEDQIALRDVARRFARETAPRTTKAGIRTGIDWPCSAKWPAGPHRVDLPQGIWWPG